MYIVQSFPDALTKKLVANKRMKRCNKCYSLKFLVEISNYKRYIQLIKSGFSIDLHSHLPRVFQFYFIYVANSVC
jgi:hypothetical protein